MPVAWLEGIHSPSPRAVSLVPDGPTHRGETGKAHQTHCDPRRGPEGGQEGPGDGPLAGWRTHRATMGDPATSIRSAGISVHRGSAWGRGGGVVDGTPRGRGSSL